MQDAKPHPMLQESSQEFSLVSRYIDVLSLQKGLSKLTLSAYQRDLLQFFHWLAHPAQHHLQAGLLERQNILSYLGYLKQQGLKNSSIARKISVLKGFFLWGILHATESIQRNPFALMERPKLSKHLPQVLSHQEVKILCERKSSPQSQCHPQETLMLQLFYACGLRVSELVTLRKQDIDVMRGVVRCIGKGDKQRQVPMPRTTAQALTQWMNQTPGEGEAFVFQRLKKKALTAHKPSPSTHKPRKRAETSMGKHWIATGKAWSRRQVWGMLRTHGRLRLSKKVHPHMLRHTFATHLLEGGMNLRFVQELLGHQDVVTTQVYTHVSRKALKEAYKKLF